MIRTLHRLAAASLALPLLAGALLAAAPEERPGARVAEVFRELHREGTGARGRARLLVDNVEAWYARWWMIDRAKESIDVTYFIVDPDVFGRSMLGLLRKKALEGVKIRLMVDARGSSELSRRIHHQGLLQALQRLPGVSVKVFNPWHKALLSFPRDVRALIASNHDKILLVDGRWTLTGGRNIGWHYFADPARHPTARRDADVLIDSSDLGEEVRLAFEEEFDGLKTKAIGRPLWGENAAETEDLELARRAMQRYLNGAGLFSPQETPFPRKLQGINEELAEYPEMQGYAHFARDVWQGRREVAMRVLDKHSFRDPRNDITANMVRLFDQAEESIYLQNPYVVPTKPVIEALMRASARGVRIVLHTNSPASSNQPITQAFFIRDWKRLLRDLPTLRIFVFQDAQVLHSKVVVIDDRIASVGTYNLDPMSEAINGEMMAVIDDPGFARRLRGKIEEDIDRSIEYRIEVDENGVLRTVVGPDLFMRGKAKILIKAFQMLPFLRHLV